MPAVGSKEEKPMAFLYKSIESRFTFLEMMRPSRPAEQYQEEVLKAVAAIKKHIMMMKENISVADVNPIMVMIRSGPLDLWKVNELIDCLSARVNVDDVPDTAEVDTTKRNLLKF